MADKMTGKKPKKVRVATGTEGGQKGGEAAVVQKEAQQGKKKK